MPKIPLSPLFLSVGLFAVPAFAQPAPPPPPAPAGPAPEPSNLPQLPPPEPPKVDAPKVEAPKVDAASPTTEPPKPAPLETTAPKDGFGFQSSDGAFVLKIKGVVQADSRWFFAGGTNQFLIRRARPTLEGTIYRYFDYRLTADLASTPSMVDVYANVRLIKELQLRVGRFKTPLGLERLQNDPEMPFIERGLPSYVVPDRDVGAMLHGEIADGTIAYALGIFDGAEDGKNMDNDTSDKKDVVGRIFVRPLVPLKIDALKNFGLGVAASRGTHTEPLPNYISPAQVSFFSYAGAVAAGTHRRLAPQAYFYYGPFGILGEWTRSTQIVASATSPATAVNNDAWQVELSGYITGENASFAMVSPKAPLDPAKGGFGAIELAVRYGALKIDDAVFDTLKFADPNKSARSAKEWAVGVNWHMARGYKLDINYENTSFEGGAPAGANRPTETAVLTRLQAVF